MGNRIAALALLSVVVPVYNEVDVLPAFLARTKNVLDDLITDGAVRGFEIIFVDDGSSDGSCEYLLSLQQRELDIAVIGFSRNFGKEAAITAGLDAAKGDAVIIIDADLQDPPELIKSFVREYAQGVDVVYGQRVSRAGESALKRSTAFLFYRILRRMASVNIPKDAGDFRLLSSRAVNALKMLPERQRFMKGLFAWIGFQQKAIPYRREPRHAGGTKWNYWRLWNFAISGVTAFSFVPLRIGSYVGVAISMLSFAYAAYIVFDTLVWGNPMPGYPSLVTLILFLGGVQLMFIGVLGEYVGRIFDEVKNRPIYLVQHYAPTQRTAGTSDHTNDHISA